MDCHEGGEPGAIYRCERVGLFGTVSVGEGRVRYRGVLKDPNELAGRTENNRVVNFAGHPRLVGQLVELRITAALPHSLRGEVPIRD